MRLRQLLRFTSFALLGAFISSCSLKPGGNSTVSFRVPSISELNAKAQEQSSGAQSKGDLTGLSIPAAEIVWANACFMVNVTGDGIESKSSSLCEVPVGVFSGSVAPGGLLSIDVKKGSDRKIEVLAYFRSLTAQPCEAKANLNDFNLSRTARLGMIEHVTLSKDVEDVEVGISRPTAGQTVATQYAFPAVCTAAGVPAGGTAVRHVSGSFIRAMSTANYQLNARVSGPPSQILKSSGNYELHRRGQ